MAEFPLTVTDIRQFYYCPRIVYFTYVQPLERPATYKMVHGQDAEERADALEKRRTLDRYGLREGRRVFDAPLESPSLALSGRADMLILTPEEVYPVEFKHTDEEPAPNHYMQVVAYSMMAREQYHCESPHGYLVRLTDGEVWQAEVTPEACREVKECLRRIREMIDAECFPDPPAGRGKCVECEFRRFCGDV
ncbi:MAG: CRISPR-associated protein Cas4 [Armatimonadetes bacterium]|nr:CRISPR-associated protein Cas4 [Armatimonadota bacterium]